MVEINRNGNLPENCELLVLMGSQSTDRYAGLGYQP